MTAQLVLVLRFIVIALLYSFLIIFLTISWKNAFNKAQITSTAIHQKLQLKNRITNEINSFQLKEIYIGRSKDANFKLMDESISNLHSRLFWKNNQWWIEDLDSTNGTFLNNVRLVSPEIIRHGDQLSCGSTEFEVLFLREEDN